MFILYWIPKNLVSYWFGRLMAIEWPQPLNSWLVLVFAKMFQINLEEAEKSIKDYKSIGAFFVRKLKSGCRPLSSSLYVHPADSRLTARGVVVGNQLVQAKGRTYSLDSFLQDSQLDRWQKGFFLTYYLCPTDYHRVHSPVEGLIKEVRYVPGNLWPVNDWSVQNISELFVKNERVIVEIATLRGPVAVVFVGATNVGSIRLTFEPSLKTNHTHRRQMQKITYVDPIPINRGDELGMFCMGSTVIVVTTWKWEMLESIVRDPSSFQVTMGSL